MIVIDSVTASDRRFARAAKELVEDAVICARRPGECEPRRNVLIVPVPVRLLSVCLSRKIELHGWSVCLAFLHASETPAKPVIEANGRGGLRSSSLIRRLQ